MSRGRAGGDRTRATSSGVARARGARRQGPGSASRRQRPARAAEALTPRRYILFNKPYGVLSSFTDPEARRLGTPPRETAADYLPVEGIYAAGRLDYDSEGLMLLTDDGALSHRLTHPRHGHTKLYLAQVERRPSPEALAQLRGGVTIKGGHRTQPAEVELLETPPKLWERRKPIRERASVPTAWLCIALGEGRKRQVRQMTAKVGHPTLRLVRVAIGPLTVDGLEPGSWRELSIDELAALRSAVRSLEGNPHRHGAKR